MPLTLFTFQSIFKVLQVIIDFAILWVVIYYVLRIVRNNSRTVQIFKGIILVIALWYVSSIMGLSTIKSLLDYVIQYAFLVVVIIFSPEIRGMLERLGKTSVFSALHSLSGNEKEQLVDELVEAAIDLSKRRVGALITIEQGHSLSDYVKTGTPINSSVTSELLSSIFVTSTPLHDGAVIIQGDRIACASAYFPPTNLDLPTSYGARHRAAIGLSEVTDSVTIVVSEETGKISIAEGGRLREMDEVSLRDYLNLIIQNSEKEVSQSISLRRQRRMNFSRLNLDPIKVEKYEEVERQPKKGVESAEEGDKPDFSKLMGIFKKKPKKLDPKDAVKKDSDEPKMDSDVDQIKHDDPDAITVELIDGEKVSFDSALVDDSVDELELETHLEEDPIEVLEVTVNEPVTEVEEEKVTKAKKTSKKTKELKADTSSEKVAKPRKPRASKKADVVEETVVLDSEVEEIPVIENEQISINEDMPVNDIGGDVDESEEK